MTQTSLKTKSSENGQTLPSWDLTDFYSSPSDPKVQEDIKSALDLSESFEKTYKGLFIGKESWSGAQLYQAIVDLEQIEDLLGKLISYGFLCFATQSNTPHIQQFFQMIQEKVTTISSHLIFFTLEINQITDDQIKKTYEDSQELCRYKPWLDNVRLFRDYQLSPDLEKLFHEKSVTGRGAWARLFEETLAAMQLNYEGQILTLAEVLDKLSDKDASVRQKGAKCLSEGLTAHLPLLTLVTNTLAKDKEIEDTWRKFPDPVASRNLANQVEGEVVEALIKTVKANYPRLSHRYYALKAKWLGQEKLNYWDRNAPLPEAEDQAISWDEAKDIVYKAYHNFSPELADIGQRFFTNNWIDVPPKPGKESGAFAHPTVPSLHPYLLLNYQGKLRDVMTLAHELGHGVHQILAAPQGPLLSDTPLTIAETASVFGEMLTFKALLEKTTNKDQRRSLLASKVDDMINTVVRQIAFYDFEYQVHTRRRDGELTAEDLGKIWLETQAEALGSAVQLDPLVGCYWGYISHFIRSPFYVYAYAFGDCLVNSLYAVYESGSPNFTERYLDLLKAGGSKRYPELLAPFGLDAKDPLFWQKGLDVISGLIDELETL